MAEKAETSETDAAEREAERRRFRRRMTLIVWAWLAGPVIAGSAVATLIAAAI